MKEKYNKVIGKVVELIDSNLIDENGSEFETLQRYLEQDYDDLISLRNRIKESSDNDIVIYEEDHIVLDHTLYSLETLIDIIKIISELSKE